MVIANGLHVIPDPEKVLSEAHRVLKSGGLLLAPTFVHGQGFGFRLRTKLLKLAGLQIYHKWDAQAYVDFVSQQYIFSWELSG